MKKQQQTAVPGRSAATRSIRSHDVIALAAFALVSALFAMTWVLVDRQISQHRERDASQAAQQAALRLADYVESRLSVVDSLAHARDHGLYEDQASFVDVAQVQQDQFGGFQAINWIDASGVIRWVVPEDINTEALGKSVFEHPQAGAVARDARDSGEPRMTPPLTLFQGKRGIATYYPVTRNDGLVGFVNGVFLTSDMVQASLRAGILDTYEVRVVDDGELVFASDQFETTATRLVAGSHVDVAGHDWLVQLAPNQAKWREINPTSHHYLLGLGLLLGAILGLVIRTVLLQKKRGGAAEKSRLRLAKLADSSLDIVAMVMPDGKLDYLNPSAGNILGLVDRRSASNLAPAPSLSDLVDPRDRDRIPDALRDIARFGRWEGSARFVHQVTHESIPLYARAFEIIEPKSGNCEGYGCIAHDMREHERLQSDLQHAMKMEAVGRLAGGIAHDFNNLLTVVLGFSDLIGMDKNANGPIAGYVAEMKKAVKQGADLTRNLLQYSRKSIYNPVRLNPEQVVTDMVQMLQRLIRSNVELTVEAENDLGVILIDRTSFEQSIANLVVNASDAIQDQGSIDISLTRRNLNGDWVVVGIRDNGIGMSPEQVEQAFEPYFTTKDVGKGTGLGLSSVYGAVTSAGGRARISSKPDEGTLVEIWLPRLSGSADKTYARKGSFCGVAMLDGRTVLIVEDEPSVRAATVKMFRNAGCQTLEAGDGVEALTVLDSAQHELVDFVISDIVMPRMGGIELVHELRRRNLSCPVVLCSGYRDPIANINELEKLNCMLIEKPYDFDALIRALDPAVRLSSVDKHAS